MDDGGNVLVAVVVGAVSTNDRQFSGGFDSNPRQRVFYQGGR
jgi:hypothetical protein